MYIYKLTRIVFNNGEEVQPGNLTVIIGPNNAGKSRTLKDIAQKTTRSTPLPGVVVSDVEWTTPQNLQELLKRIVWNATKTNITTGCFVH